jgi:hypothetical protein
VPQAHLEELPVLLPEVRGCTHLQRLRQLSNTANSATAPCLVQLVGHQCCHQCRGCAWAAAFKHKVAEVLQQQQATHKKHNMYQAAM